MMHQTVWCFDRCIWTKCVRCQSVVSYTGPELKIIILRHRTNVCQLVVKKFLSFVHRTDVSGVASTLYVSANILSGSGKYFFTTLNTAIKTPYKSGALLGLYTVI